MDYKNMSDSELASVMVNYISRVENLMNIISRYLHYPNDKNISSESIKNEYGRLKSELRDDAHYLDLVRNRSGSQLYMYAFSPSIKGASAFGFALPANHRIDQRFYSAVEEAHYKLGKYHSFDEWEALM